MKQEAVAFGKNKDMIGVLSTNELNPSKHKIAVLCWNTGISHRVGPNRVNFDIAKALAYIGVPVFRFDLRGRGDSQPLRGEEASFIQDVRETMDFLQETYGFTRFVLHGHCSGAIEAHHVTKEDSRVIGLSMVDTYAHRVGKYYANYYLKRIFSPYHWSRLLGKLSGKKTASSSLQQDHYFVPFPSLTQIRSDFKLFASRGVQCLVIYTSGYDYVYNYKNQFYDMLTGVPVAGILTLQLHNKADHLYTLIEQRRALINSICHWAGQVILSRLDQEYENSMLVGVALEPRLGHL